MACFVNDLTFATGAMLRRFFHEWVALCFLWPLNQWIVDHIESPAHQRIPLSALG